MTIKAIATRYAGCHFRSRLEARWAVFFDHLGIEWEYEPQGFEGCWGDHYLPDFHLKVEAPVLSSCLDYGDPVYDRSGVYVEVKGSPESLIADSGKIEQVVEYEGPCAQGVIILSPIPRKPRSHPMTHWHKGAVQSDVKFRQGGLNAGRNARFDYSDAWNAQGGPPAMSHTEARHLLDGWTTMTDQAVQRALNAARSARFEHGQSGAT